MPASAWRGFKTRIFAQGVVPALRVSESVADLERVQLELLGEPPGTQITMPDPSITMMSLLLKLP